MITETDFLTLAFYSLVGELIFLGALGLIYLAKLIQLNLTGGNKK